MFTEDDLLRSIYRAALDREPDPEAGSVFGAKLRTDPQSADDIARSIFASREHHERFAGNGRLSDHSQCGEVVLLLRRLLHRGSRRQIVVDVGARGRERSNSYDLLRSFGWRGLLVEANPSLHAQIEQEFVDTDFTLVRCAVGIEPGDMPFYIGDNDDVSSLLRDAAASWGPVRREIVVPVRRLPEILDEHSVPFDFDVLSLDIEGVDMPVLNDLIETSAYRPRHVIIEASYDFATRHLSEVGAAEKVQHVYRIIDQTTVNLILEASD